MLLDTPKPYTPGMNQITTQHGTTAAGDQVFLGRYHRLGDPGRGEPQGGASEGASEGMPWVGCSIPLAMSHACIAVCPFRGWAAVCTGSVVSWLPSSSNVNIISRRSLETLYLRALVGSKTRAR